MPTEQRTVTANGLEFACLTDGPEDGPLALCLHGFPDTAHTWRYLLPELAAAGFRAVAPFQRGYAPTAIPADGHYQVGALVQDANALHEVLGGGADAVIIGHDWGALATYGAVAHQPDRWRRAVTAAVPPTASIGMSLFTYAQLQKSWYMFFFLSPTAEIALPLDDYTFIDHLWRDWSPGYDGTWDAARVKESIGDPEHIVAAIGYYRAMWDPALQSPELADEQAAALMPTPKPTLYLHGRDDNCMLLSSIGSPLDFLADGSEVADHRRHRPLLARGAARGREPAHRPFPDDVAAVAPLFCGYRSRRTGSFPRDHVAKPSATTAPATRSARAGSSGQPQAPARPLCRTPPRRNASSRRPLPWRSDPANVLCGRAVGLSRHGSGTSVRTLSRRQVH